MKFLPAIKVYDGEAFSQTSYYEVNQTAYNFTGYTGAWTIKRGDTVLLSGNVTLGTDGAMTIGFSAADTPSLQPYTKERGFVLPGVTYTSIITNGFETLVFKAPVQFIRNKNTVQPYSFPGWYL